ncbi:DUF6515 family protein [candidate division KSB1 bacterium]
MKTRIIPLVLMLVFSLTLLTAEADAQRRGQRGRRSAPAIRHRPQYRHKTISRLPFGHRRMRFGGHNYFHHGGRFYRRSRIGFSIVTGPLGARFHVLPPGYTTIHFGGIPYYRHYGTYYNYRPETKEYVVVEPPSEAAAGDVIKTKGGSTLVGRFLGGDETTVEMEVDGEVIEIEVANIQSITFKQTVESDKEE